MFVVGVVAVVVAIMRVSSTSRPSPLPLHAGWNFLINEALVGNALASPH